MGVPLRQTAAALTGRRPVDRGWWILAGSIAGAATAGGLLFWSFGLLIQPIEEEFGWSRAAVSLGFSLMLLTGGVTGPLVGRWVDVRGPRSAMIIGTVAVGGITLLTATTNALWQWYLYLSLSGCFRGLIFGIPSSALLTRWFTERRGLALSMVGTGLSLGALFMVPLMRLVIDLVDWDGAMIFTGTAIIVVILPFALFVVRDHPPTTRSPARPAGPPAPLPGVELRPAMRTALFWTMTAAMTLQMMGGITWLVHSVPFYESVGVSPGGAAGLVSLGAGLGLVWRVGIGLVADRVRSWELGAGGLTALFAVGAAVLLIDHGAVGIGIYVVLFSLGNAGGPMFQPLLISRAFGLRRMGILMGTVTIIATGPMLTGPLIAGAIFDATGTYNGALVMMVAVLGTSALLFLIAARLSHPQFPDGREPEGTGERIAPRAQREGTAGTG